MVKRNEFRAPTRPVSTAPLIFRSAGEPLGQWLLDGGNSFHGFPPLVRPKTWICNLLISSIVGGSYLEGNCSGAASAGAIQRSATRAKYTFSGGRPASKRMGALRTSTQPRRRSHA